MTDKLNVITGATGLLGSHVAEQLIASGERVRALVRSSSDTAFLRQLGADLAVGDLCDPESLRCCVAGADIVYHCAAKVGEWGPWRQFQTEIIDATRNLLDACRSVGVGRVLHVSSITVYGNLKALGHGQETMPQQGFTEEQPLGQNLWLWDYYRRAKIAAEELVRHYPGAWSIVRPSWIYGPRDRTTLPRVAKAILAGRVSLLGTGDNLLNIIHAADVAAGAILAANHPGAVGEAYNLSSAGEITQRRLLDTMTNLLGVPHVTRQFPYQPAFWVGFLFEVIGRLIFMRRPPHITRYVVSLIGRPTQFSTGKARTQLGWRARVGIEEGLRETLDWYQRCEGTAAGAKVA
jgi:nucleoside-diphosphate-sugar epimerase